MSFFGIHWMEDGPAKQARWEEEEAFGESLKHVVITPSIRLKTAKDYDYFPTEMEEFSERMRKLREE